MSSSSFVLLILSSTFLCCHIIFVFPQFLLVFFLSPSLSSSAYFLAIFQPSFISSPLFSLPFYLFHLCWPVYTFLLHLHSFLAWHLEYPVSVYNIRQQKVQKQVNFEIIRFSWWNNAAQLRCKHCISASCAVLVWTLSAAISCLSNSDSPPLCPLSFFTSCSLLFSPSLSAVRLLQL